MTDDTNSETGAAPARIEGAFCWHELGTTDIAKAKDFYSQVFGWQMTDMPMPGGMEGTYTTFGTPEHTVGGMYQMEGEGFEGVPPHWGSYVLSSDVDGAAEKTAAAGGAVLQPPFDVPGVGRMTAVQDPTGAIVSFMRPLPESPLAALGMEPGRVGWNELTTSDADAAKAFYGSVLGWAYQDDPMATGGTYTTIKSGDAPVGGLLAMDAEMQSQMPSQWMPYFNVITCAGFVAKAQQLGGQVLVSPEEIEGVGKFAVLADPTGAPFAIIRFEMPEQ